MIRFRFNKQKAIAAILYILQKLTRDRRAWPDFHKVFKILYFADEKHLAQYGRPIVGDHYVAMDHGPVPSNIYDMLKAVRGDSIFCSADEFDQYFRVRGYYVFPKQEPDMDEFSDSDLECIDESIKENGHLDFSELKDKSHDSAYNKAQKDDKIPFLEMAKIGGANQGMLDYIRTLSENELHHTYAACSIL